MPSLAEFQRLMAADLLGGGVCAAALADGSSPIPAEAALDVHRATVFGGLSRALELTFPTVVRALGDDSFHAAATAFAARHPPTEAVLSGYGEGFPAFLRNLAIANDLPWLGDAARLDLAIERASRAADGRRSTPLDRSAALETPASLQLVELDFAVDELRETLEAANACPDAAAPPEPLPVRLAIWRGEGGVRSVRLAAPAARFLAALLAGRSPDDALADAQSECPLDAALDAIRCDVFCAPFAAIAHALAEGPPA